MLKARRLSLYAPRIRERYDRFYIRASAHPRTRSSRRGGGRERRGDARYSEGVYRGSLGGGGREAKKIQRGNYREGTNGSSLESLSFYGFPSADRVIGFIGRLLEQPLSLSLSLPLSLSSALLPFLSSIFVLFLFFQLNTVLFYIS